MMNLAAAAPARGVLLMQPVGEVREAFSTREIYGPGVFDAPGFWKKLVRRVKRMAAFLPGIFAYHEGFLRFSGSSGCTSRRTWGRICNTRKDLCEKSLWAHQLELSEPKLGSHDHFILVSNTNSGYFYCYFHSKKLPLLSQCVLLLLKVVTVSYAPEIAFE
jgi:hypothetical protein